MTFRLREYWCTFHRRRLDLWLFVCLLAALVLYPVTLEARPVLQAEPTGDPCAAPTLTLVRDGANLRSGPGAEYSVLARVDAGGVLAVTGRHPQVEWWQVQTSDGTTAWVWNDVVTAQGNIASVPIVLAPDEEGVEAEGEAVDWVPSVLEPCSAVPALDAVTMQSTPIPGNAEDTAEEPEASDDGWGTPINLSRSGAATDPQMVKDTQGHFHVIWQDAVNDFVYSHGSDDSWSEPVPVELPFGTRRFFPDLMPEHETPLFRPLLVGDARGQVHAFWVDDVGMLFHSSVPAPEFGDFEAWAEPRPLAEGVLALGASLGGNILHLSYIRFLDSRELPAGVYYQPLSTDAVELSPPVLLSQSGYFRSLSRDATNVQIATAETGQVFVAWDNRPLEKVYLVRSNNGGDSWDPPIEVDGRMATDSPDAAGPANILLSVSGSNVLALWVAAHEGLTCALYYRWSSDGGNTWQQNRPVEVVQGCPEQSQLLQLGEDFTVLMATATGTTYLVAWDGRVWSRAVAQDSLSVFVNQETFKQVSFGCHQAALATDRLYVVGCDAGGGQDIWLKSRQLGSPGDWFSDPPVWNSSLTVTTDGVGIESPLVVADAGGRLHVFWVQLNGPAIYHTVWDGLRWSHPNIIFTSPTTKAGEPAAIVDTAGRVLVTWGDTQSGQIHLIQAEVDKAMVASNWSSPLDLLRLGPAAAWPDIVVGQSGRIYLSYAVPVNEGRGIYLTWSDDRGESWVEPVSVFDGATSGWAMVGRPRLALTDNDRIHVVWTRHTIPGGTGPMALFYGHSADGGRTWSEPTEITEALVSWSEVVGIGEQSVHLIWQEVDGSSAILRHLLSSDGGASWNVPVTVSSVEETTGPVAVTVDGNGRLHLLRGTGPATQHWMWNGERWSRAEELKLDPAVAVGELAAAVTSDGHLGLVYTGQPDIQNSLGSPDTLFYASRSLDGAAVPAATPQPAATVAPSRSPATTASPSPSPTTYFPAVSESDSQLPLSQETALAIGILPAALIVLIGFAVSLRVVRSGRP